MVFRIKEAREKVGLSQKDLATALGIKPSTFNGYEKGTHDPKSEILKSIAIKCNTTVDFLLGLPESERINLTSHEEKVITAYRKQPTMQEAVDRLLAIEPEQQEVKKLA